jgi:excisionase family DNA binding protein
VQDNVTTACPAAYRVDDIQEILGIGRSSAYGLIKQSGFPCVRVGTRVVIPADLFHEWLREQAGKGGEGNGQG